MRLDAKIRKVAEKVDTTQFVRCGPYQGVAAARSQCVKHRVVRATYGPTQSDLLRPAATSIP